MVSDMGLSARRYRDELEVFVSSLASADPQGCAASCSTRRATGCRCKPPTPRSSPLDQVQGARLLLAEQGKHLAVLRFSTGGARSLHLRSGTQPGRPSSSICSAGAISIVPASGFDSEILLKGRMVSCCRGWR